MKNLQYEGKNYKISKEKSHFFKAKKFMLSKLIWKSLKKVLGWRLMSIY